MKKFIKFNILAFLLVGLTLTSCKSSDEEVEDTGYLFDVVYQAVATRQDKTFPWIPVTGVMQVKFEQTTEEEGLYTIYFNSYDEPQHVYPICSGGFKGNFQLIELQDTSTGGTSTNFDPNGAYDSGVTVSDSGDYDGDADTEDEPAQISSYHMATQYSIRSLDDACRPSEDSNQTLHIYRFSNGEIIMRKEYRDIKMRPVLTSESQVQ